MAAVVAVLVGVVATRPSAQVASARSQLIGRMAPELGGTALAGGGAVHLSSLRGRFVLVNFFAGWCPPCHTEEPELVALDYQHRAAGDLSIVGVAYQDTAGDARSFLRSTGATWPAVADPGGRFAYDYGVQGPPQSFLVAPDGRVAAAIFGPVTQSRVDQAMAAVRTEGA